MSQDTNELRLVQEKIKNQANQKRPTDGQLKGRASSAAHLVFYTFLVIDVCLSLFNSYLFYLIWSTLNGTSDSYLFANQEASGKSSHLDLISSWKRIKSSGQKMSFTSKLEAHKATSDLDKIRIVGQSGLMLAPIGSNQTSVELISGNRSSIRFASGLLVQDPSGKLRASCSQDGHCRLEGAKRVLMSRAGGIQMDRKSVQTSKLMTNRLHSRTRQLRLLGTNSSHFRSMDGPISISALADVTLLSHNSAIVVRASAVHLGAIRGLAGQRRPLEEGSGYKLCVCLPVGRMDPEKNKQLGLVFGVRPSLSCAKFSSSICRGQRTAR